MTENAFFPAFVLAAYALAVALERPTLLNQGLALGACVVASGGARAGDRPLRDPGGGRRAQGAPRPAGRGRAPEGAGEAVPAHARRARGRGARLRAPEDSSGRRPGVGARLVRGGEHPVRLGRRVALDPSPRGRARAARRRGSARGADRPGRAGLDPRAAECGGARVRRRRRACRRPGRRPGRDLRVALLVPHPGAQHVPRRAAPAAGARLLARVAAHRGRPSSPAVAALGVGGVAPGASPVVAVERLDLLGHVRADSAPSPRPGRRATCASTCSREAWRQPSPSSSCPAGSRAIVLPLGDRAATSRWPRTR